LGRTNIGTALQGESLRDESLTSPITSMYLAATIVSLLPVIFPKLSNFIHDNLQGRINSTFSFTKIRKI
ncbi:MAG: hypothetical protein ACE5K2_07850, partial [Candidatus Zixiibacteriota bacterium]